MDLPEQKAKAKEPLLILPQDADICDARTYYTSCMPPDNVCDLWMMNGHNCDTSWSSVCNTDHPEGAEKNDVTLDSSGCSQCMAPLMG